MADDIVKRLENACAHPCDLCQRENAYVVGEDAAIQIEAQQAEIERLRAAGDALAAWLTANTSERQKMSPSYNDVLRAWQEARHG